MLIFAENPVAGDAELSTTSSDRYLTTTTPPAGWIVREDQAASLVGGAEVDEEPGDVGDERSVLVVDEVLLLDEEVGADDVVDSEVLEAGAT